MLIAFLQTSEVMKVVWLFKVAEEDGRKKKADFTEKADIAKFGYI